MGAAFSDAPAQPAPRPTRPAQMFVLRNGEYRAEPVSLPMMGSWDVGSVTLPESLPRLPIGTTPSVCQAAVVQNPVHLPPRSISLVRHQSCVNLMGMHFTVDSCVPGRVAVWYGASSDHVCKRRPVSNCDDVTAPAAPQNARVVFEKDFDAGLSIPFEVGGAACFNVLQYEQMSTFSESAHFPILIEIALTGAQNDFRLLTFASHTSLAERWGVRVLKQVLVCEEAEMPFEIKEVFGGSEQSAVGGDAEARECVICMSDEPTTMVLPCRHMCLCSHCSSILRLQSAKCPMCRQRVVSMRQIAS
mmetsp:Transcript_33604/g.77055  ORF Transcript_33604/g.77055 Transcript_33604/m.77055 type:complete len:303 (+) Transcript_33604:62-970(+)